jgi:signal peptidase I
MTEAHQDTGVGPTRGDEPLPEEPARGVEPQAQEDREQWSLARWLGETVLLLGLAFLLAMGIKTYIAQPFVIPTGSMQPTVEINDRVFYNKFVYRFAEPAAGDIVVFDNPEDPGGTPLTKRVIAVGGQTVEVRDGYVYVDGVQIDEPYVQAENRGGPSLPEPVEVPAGYVWLMGDNRAHSGDSRIFGPQPADNIQGKAFVIYWPLDRFGSL